MGTCTFIYMMCVLNCVGPYGMITASKRLSKNECLNYRKVYDKQSDKTNKIKELELEIQKLKRETNVKEKRK